MKNVYCLSPTFYPLKKDFRWTLFPETAKFRSEIRTADILSDECLAWINTLGLEIIHVIVFNKSPKFSPNPHVDGHPPHGRHFSINWNLTGSARMKWFKTSYPDTKVDEFLSNSIPYVGYEKKYCILIESSEALGPVLFRTSIPHLVENTGDDWARSISISFKQKYTWAESVEFFKDWIIC